MSGKVGGQVWELELDRPKKWVLLAMADNAHDDGSKCFPGVRYLAWKTGYSERQVQRIIRGLCSDGLLTPVAYIGGGRGHATEYKINVEKGVKKSSYIRKGDKPGLQRVTDNSEKGDTQMAPQPSENRHSLTPKEKEWFKGHEHLIDN